MILLIFKQSSILDLKIVNIYLFEYILKALKHNHDI